MKRKRKNRALSWKERFEREEDDTLFEERIRERIERYTSKFKGDVERIYREYISGRHWVARKDSFFKNHEKKCALCRSTFRVELNHIYYENFGFEKDEDLIPLCREHHEALHRHIGVSKDMRYATADFIEWQRDLIQKPPKEL